MKKINLTITGCLGRMGQQLVKSSKSAKDFKLVSVTENRIINKKISGLRPQLNSVSAFKNANIIIDFTIPKCTLEVLKIASKLKKKVVIGTTGFSKREENLIKKYHLDQGKDPQQFGIGFKEIWEVSENQHQEGLVMHTVGWPLDNKTYGGSFVYHAEKKQIFIGYVVGLDYQNPHLSPFDEFQRFKMHPAIRKILEGGKRISYGARALIEGGIQSLPKMYMPGALLIGCDAGTLNMPKIKGSHTAMKSGIIAAETIVEHIKNNTDLSIYETKFKKSWAFKELYAARNVKPSFRWSLILGILFTGLDQILFRGRLPFTLKHKHADHETLKPARQMPKIEYPKPDGKISFDKTSSVYLTGTNHAENQPVHLQLKDSNLPINYTLKEFDEPAQRYCPVGVYEVQRDKDNQNPKFVINSQNCIHCKTCDIKEPSQNITWVVPEGGGGPRYGNM